MNLLQKLSVVAAFGVTLVVSAVAYVYMQPGKNMKIKWRRSYRRMRKLSKDLLKSSKSSNTNLIPMVQGLIGVMQFVMDRLPA